MKYKNLFKGASILLSALLAFETPIQINAAEIKGIESSSIERVSYGSTFQLSALENNRVMGAISTTSAGLIYFNITSISGMVSFIAKDSNGNRVGNISRVTSKGVYSMAVTKNSTVNLFINNNETKETTVTVAWGTTYSDVAF